MPPMTISLAAWLTAAFVLYRISESDRRSGIDRRCSASSVFAAAAIASLPVFVADVLPVIGHPSPSPMVVFGAYFISVFSLVMYEKPRIGGQVVTEMIESQDNDISERVRGISQRLGILAPSIRQLRSIGAALPAQAFACGMLRPKIIVGDGIMVRFPERERDAVIAHELAHIATRSIWCLAAVIPVCASVVVIVNPDGERLVATALLGALLFVGLHRLLSRPFEVACDRAAGRHVGWDAMSSSLEKLHALHVVDGDSVVGRIAYAAASHPHPDVRRAALARSAGRAVPPGPVPFRKELIHRACAWAALAVWIFAIIRILDDIRTPSQGRFAIITAALVTLAPTLLILIAAVPALRNSIRLLGRMPRNFLAALFCLASYVVAAVGVLSERVDVTIIGVVASITSMVALIVASRAQKSINAVTKGIRDRRFAEAAAAFDHATGENRGDRDLRLMGALAYFLAGRRDEALAVSRSLIDHDPGFRGASVNLAMFNLDSHPDRSVEIFADLLKKDPTSAALACYLARSLRVVGRLEEAKAFLERALTNSTRAEAGFAHGLAASVESGLGDRESARRHLDAANAMNVGHPLTVIAAADFALAFDTLEAAEKAVAQAEAIEQSVPTALIGAEVAILRRELVRRRATTTNECP